MDHLKQGTQMNNVLRTISISLIFCALFVVFSYFYIDRAVAIYNYQSNLYQWPIFRWITYIPGTIDALTPVVIIVLGIKQTITPLRHFERVWWVISQNVAACIVIKILLKYLFGRYWPLTWIDHNLSLIRNNAYGFNWLHGNALRAAFPSGHTAVTFAVMVVLWHVYPKWRWLYVTVCVAVMISLIASDYHFVSDVIAGAVLGYLTATFAWSFYLGKRV